MRAYLRETAKAALRALAALANAETANALKGFFKTGKGGIRVPGLPSECASDRISYAGRSRIQKAGYGRVRVAMTSETMEGDTYSTRAIAERR